MRPLRLLTSLCLRLAPLTMLLPGACSRGDLMEGGPGPDAADLAAAGDLAPAADLAPQRSRFLVPAWVRTISGGLSSWGPYVAPVPPRGETAEAEVVLGFTKGYDVEQITVGEGDPGATQIVGKFKPVLAWLDRRDGRVLRARQVAGDQSPTERASVVMEAGIDVSPAGQVVLGGQFHGSAIFNPGTGAAQAQRAEKRVVGDTLHRAEDPFMVRYGADAAPSWFARGRTPGPLSTTWFNYCQGIAALGDGGALVAGRYEMGGFILAPGTAGEKTFTGGRGGYLARLGPQGVPAWAGRTSGEIGLSRGVRSGPDGSPYLLGRIHGSGALMADSAQPTQLTALPGRTTYAVVKLTPDGGPGWVRRLVMDNLAAPADFAVTPEGRVVVAGNLQGKLDVLADGDRIEASLESKEPQGYVAAFGADGTFAWLTLLGEDVENAGPLALAGGEAWVTATTGIATRSLPLDGAGPAVLPEVTAAADATLTLLYRVSAAGKRLAVDVVGLNLPVYDVAAAADGALALTGAYGDWAMDIRVGAADGLRTLPLNASKFDQTVYVLALRAR
jgi:hypothetical protein